MQVKSIAVGEHFAILSTFIKLPFVIKIVVCLFLSVRFTHILLYMPTCKWRPYALIFVRIPYVVFGNALYNVYAKNILHV